MFNVFGSASSQDLDAIYLVDSLGLVQDNKATVARLEAELKAQYSFSKVLNLNLGVVKEGVLVEVFKGTVDEVNNSMIDTYAFHTQYFPLMISKRLERDSDLKQVRALRIILSFLSRSSLRKQVKEALKGSSAQKYDLLKSLDLSSIEDLGNKNSNFEDYQKTVAFQLGQAYGLLEGKEFYSKESISESYPSLRPFLFRQGGEMMALESFKKQWLLALDISKNKYSKEPPRD